MLRQLKFAALAVVLVCAFQFPGGVAVSQQAQDGSLFTATKEQLAVVRVVLAQQAAWNRGDLDAFFSHYKDDPDTEAVLGGPAKGLPTIRNAYRINYPNKDTMGKVEYTDVQARILGENFALATGHYHLDRNKKSGGSADGTFTEILEKAATGWQVIFSETT